MRRFYAPYIKNDNIISGSEANHIANVLRMQKGDRVILFDGSGYDYYCEISDIKKGEVCFNINDTKYNENEPECNITLYAASIKKDKMDFAFQKASELGISKLCVFDSARSVKKIKDAEKMKEHLERVGIEAAKQCGRSKIPQVEILKNTKAVAERINAHDVVVFAYEEEKTELISDILKNSGNDIGIVIGPEGGFEESEAEMLINSGAKVCSLGKLILRAETASIASVAMVIFAKEMQ